MRSTSLAGALLLGLAIAVNGQDTNVKPKTKVDRDEARPVTFTGCVATGTETQTYVLEKVAPVSRTTTSETTGTSGTVASTTPTYLLVPGQNVQLQTHVGRKVEVTGVVIPAGEPKMRTQRNIEREAAPDTKMKEETNSGYDRPRLRVISVRELQEAC